MPNLEAAVEQSVLTHGRQAISRLIWKSGKVALDGYIVRLLRLRHASASGAELRCFVGGAFVDGASTFAKVDPVDGSVVAHVHAADPGVVDAAVASARQALEGPWGVMSTPERVRLLRRLADRIEDRFEEFVEAEVRDTGKPTVTARQLDVGRAVTNFRQFADTVSVQGLDSFMTELPTADGHSTTRWRSRWVWSR